MAAVADKLEEAVDICDAAFIAYLDADADLDAAFGHAFLQHQGPQTEKRWAAEVATAAIRKQRNIAYAASKRADRNARALESRLTSLQTTSKSVNSAYNAGGRR